MSMVDRVDRVLHDLVERKHAPGVAAVVVNDKEMIYQGAAGVMGTDRAEPMTPSTIVWYASMTKALVAAGGMQLVEQGLVDLDVPVSKYLPELNAPKVLDGFTSDGEPILRPATRPITARHLFTHTSGFGYNWANGVILRYIEKYDIPDLILCKTRSLDQPLLAEPGERWEYGISIDWIGQLVERISGKSLRNYLRAHVFEPLGMLDTDFTQTPAQKRGRASVHEKAADGRLRAIPLEVEQNPEFFMGGGGLCGTAIDYGAFVQMILSSGRSKSGAAVLKPETVALMAEDHIAPLQVRPIESAMRNLSHDVDFFPGMPQGWGLSFLINRERSPEGRSAGSLSWAGLANSYYWIDPTARLGGVFFTQVLPFADPTILAAYRAMEKVVYEEFSTARAA